MAQMAVGGCPDGGDGFACADCIESVMEDAYDAGVEAALGVVGHEGYLAGEIRKLKEKPCRPPK